MARRPRPDFVGLATDILESGPLISKEGVMKMNWFWIIVAIGVACLWAYFDERKAAKERLQQNDRDVVDGDDTD